MGFSAATWPSTRDKLQLPLAHREPRLMLSQISWCVKGKFAWNARASYLLLADIV
jgi:hypothetical protein